MSHILKMDCDEKKVNHYPRLGPFPPFGRPLPTRAGVRRGAVSTLFPH